jgi:hypothetical protein
MEFSPSRIAYAVCFIGHENYVCGNHIGVHDGGRQNFSKCSLDPFFGHDLSLIHGTVESLCAGEG